MSNEIQAYNNGHSVAVHPMDGDPVELKAALDRRTTNRQLVMDWIKSGLVEGVDYGKIHTAGKNRCQYAAQYRGNECPNPAHWSKPQLFKAGAEKVSGMLGLRIEYPSLPEYERMVLEGNQIVHVVLRCQLVGPTGIVAEGVGARTLAKDDGDLNKALKMAEKSGLIDACLRVAGLSAIFGQDAESEDEKIAVGKQTNTHDHNVRPQSGQNGTGRQAPAQTPPPPPAPPAQATQEEIEEVAALSQEAGISSARLSSWIQAATKLRATTPEELTSAEVQILIRKLKAKMSERSTERVIEGTIIPDGYQVESSTL